MIYDAGAARVKTDLGDARSIVSQPRRDRAGSGWSHGRQSSGRLLGAERLRYLPADERLLTKIT